MKLRLERNIQAADGFFGHLMHEDGSMLAFTLEHSYPDGKGGFTAKLQPGTYQCVRGLHQLAGMAAPFSTFEITGVAGHSGILFHVGNTNADSEGCVLLGNSIIRTGTRRELAASKLAFLRFSSETEAVGSFQLEVVNV